MAGGEPSGSSFLQRPDAYGYDGGCLGSVHRPRRVSRSSDRRRGLPPASENSFAPGVIAAAGAPEAAPAAKFPVPDGVECQGPRVRGSCRAAARRPARGSSQREGAEQRRRARVRAQAPARPAGGAARQVRRRVLDRTVLLSPSLAPRWSTVERINHPGSSTAGHENDQARALFASCSTSSRYRPGRSHRGSQMVSTAAQSPMIERRLLPGLPREQELPLISANQRYGDVELVEILGRHLRGRDLGREQISSSARTMNASMCSSSRQNRPNAHAAVPARRRQGPAGGPATHREPAAAKRGTIVELLRLAEEVPGASSARRSLPRSTSAMSSAFVACSSRLTRRASVRGDGEEIDELRREREPREELLRLVAGLDRGDLAPHLLAVEAARRAPTARPASARSLPSQRPPSGCRSPRRRRRAARRRGSGRRRRRSCAGPAR